jgi:hypothetical protein
MPGESQQTPGSAPDPTVMVTEAIARAKDAERDYVNGKIEVITERLRGIDKATEVLHETVTRTPTEIQLAIGHLRELTDEKYHSTTLQFAERDIRTEQASKAAKEALDAALLAAKELVTAQNVANAAAAAKSEDNFTKLLDQTATLIRNQGEAADARLTEIKERIDRGAGGDEGAQRTRTESRLDTGQLMYLVIVIVAVAGLAVSLATR